MSEPKRNSTVYVDNSASADYSGLDIFACVILSDPDFSVSGFMLSFLAHPRCGRAIWKLTFTWVTENDSIKALSPGDVSRLKSHPGNCLDFTSYISLCDLTLQPGHIPG